MKIDDVGSLPLPVGVSPEGFHSALSGDVISPWAVELMEDMMKMKIDAGIEVPCYPQMRSMVDQFVTLLTDEERCIDPYLIKRGVRMPELKVMDIVDHKCKKACLTGPFELSLKEFGEPRGEMMKRIGESLKRLVKGEGMEVVSIDEPSLGIRRPFEFDPGSLIEAWNVICEIDAFVEIHLHSLYFQESVCKSDIDAVDFPIGENERNLNLVNEKMLEEYDMKARVGVSKTDVMSESNASKPDQVADNLRRASEVLGDMIEYCGPDCGLGGLNSTDLAEKILELTSEGVQLYRDEFRNQSK